MSEHCATRGARCLDPHEAFWLAPQMNESKKWRATGVQNLMRYQPSGTYFARLKVRGRVIWKSLQTNVFSVAKQRLPDLLRERRLLAQSGTPIHGGKMLVADAANQYLKKIAASASLKPSSKRYRAMLVEFIRRSSPSLFAMDSRKTTERDCEDWLQRYQRKYSPSVVNNSIGTLRAIFDEAIRAGSRYSNPAVTLQPAKIRAIPRELPSRQQFGRLVDEIRSAGARQSADCANLVRFLAYSGLRIGEARYVTWGDVDFQRRVLRVRGHPETGTKNGHTRFVPLIPVLEQLLTEIRTSRSLEQPATAVMRVFECRLSLTHAAERIGIRRMTHHDLRHLFATVCIESGVDIPTVSRWLGHKDGGALCMRTYGHLRDDHSAAQAQRVTFGEVVRPEPSAAANDSTTDLREG